MQTDSQLLRKEVTLEKLLTPEDVAELLGRPRLFVIRQARNGDIPAIKLGKAWRFRRSAIETWLAKKERDAHDGAIGRGSDVR